jgi:uncharacterized phage protein (TIGR02220 family)
MAQRMIDTNLWNDPKVTDDMTPEDRYFWLYLLTSKYGNLLGVYEITYKQISRDMGYNEESIRNLIYRFKYIHKLIDYNEETKEVFIFNWYKYNWTKSPSFERAFEKQINDVKDTKFKEEALRMYDEFKKGDTVSTPCHIIYKPISIYDLDKNIVREQDNSIVDNKNKDNNGVWKEIIDYLNKVCGTRFKYIDESKKLINARLEQGYTVDDIKSVIDKKYDEWHGTDMGKYLRPSTLFNKTKFDSYYNEKPKSRQNLNDRYAF